MVEEGEDLEGDAEAAPPQRVLRSPLLVELCVDAGARGSRVQRRLGARLVDRHAHEAAGCGDALERLHELEGREAVEAGCGLVEE